MLLYIMPPSNRAAYFPSPDKAPIHVASARYYEPGPNELLVRVHAVAINPVDSFKQIMGKMMFPWLEYPLIAGSDVAGEVVETGSSIKRFRKGDRVFSIAMGFDRRGKRPQEGAFQEYMIARDHLTAKMPLETRYADACVVPLGASTAACGLFEKEQLALERPKLGDEKTKTGKTVLIWGASTSVGNNAVQLAVAAGYEVIATATPKNWEAIRRLGAAEVFDYRSQTVDQDIISTFQGRDCAGAFAIGQGSLSHCIDIVRRLPGRRFVAQASIDTPGPFPSNKVAIIPFLVKFLWIKLAVWFKIKRSGVRSKFIFGSDLVEWDADGTVFRYLEEALRRGEYTTTPEALVVGNGLEKIQEGLNIMLKGVSAKKVVVTLE